MTIELPDYLLRQYSESDIRLEIAVTLYQADIFTLGQASHFLGMTQRAFQRELGKRQVPAHYDEVMLENDMKTLKALFDDRHQ